MEEEKWTEAKEDLEKAWQQYEQSDLQKEKRRIQKLLDKVRSFSPES